MMNDRLNFVFSRRSIREYSDRPVDDNTVSDLLEAAMAAPSACAKDPWHFVVVREKARLQRLTEGLPNGQMLAEAGVGIVVCGKLSEAHGELESYLLQDCSAAIENILLAASALGLGACWLGVHPREERVAHLKSVLELPDGVVPVSVVSVGWPGEEKEARTRFNLLKVHKEQW
jgi:nitroreductase